MQKKSMLTKNSYVIIILSVCALFIPIVLTEYGVLKFSGGIFSYPLDDTYIHMSIAKNFAQNGTWGINAHQFSAASSSILYTILLAVLFKIFSANVLIPFILNAITAIILLIVIQKRLAERKCGFPRAIFNPVNSNFFYTTSRISYQRYGTYITMPVFFFVPV